MAELKTRVDVEAWLKDKPGNLAIVFAARVALRSAVFLGFARLSRGDDRDPGSVIILPSLYGMATALSAGTYPDRAVDLKAGAAAAAYAAADAADAAYAAAYAAADAAYAAAAATYDVAAANAAAATYDAADAADAAYAAADFWSAFNRDAGFWTERIEAGDDPQAAVRALGAQPLWPGGMAGLPDDVKQIWDEFRRDLESRDEDWDVWIRWYEDRINGVPIDDTIDLETAKLKSLEENWKKGAKVANAELKRIIEEYWGRLQQSEADYPSDSRDDVADLQQVPGIYAFALHDDLITAVPHNSNASHAEMAEQARAALLAQYKRALDKLADNMADPVILDALKDVISALDQDISDVPAGALQMQASAITGFAEIYKVSEYATDKVTGGMLAALDRATEHFLGFFPELADVEAQRLALRMQSEDAVSVEAEIVKISEIAATARIVSSEALEALRLGQDQVKALSEKLQVLSLSSQDAALVFKERGQIVSSRLLTVRNFTAASLAGADAESKTRQKVTEASGKQGSALGRGIKAAGKAIGKGALSGLEKGTEDTVKGAVKGGFALFVGAIAGPIAGIAVFVGSMRGMAKKTEDVKKSEEDAPNIDVDV